MNPEEAKEQLEEMFDSLYELPSEYRDNIEGFALVFKVNDRIGCNISLSLLEIPLEEKCNIISQLAGRLKVTPDEYINHLKYEVDKVLGVLKDMGVR